MAQRETEANGTFTIINGPTASEIRRTQNDGWKQPLTFRVETDEMPKLMDIRANEETATTVRRAGRRWEFIGTACMRNGVPFRAHISYIPGNAEDDPVSGTIVCTTVPTAETTVGSS